MKVKYIILIIFLYLLTIVQSATSISFETSGEGFTVTDDVVEITGQGPFDLSGEKANKTIKISSSCKLNLNGFSLINMGNETPILISANKAVELVLTGESTLEDSEENENEGAIYLQSGSSLTISGTGLLNLKPHNIMAINGTTGTSLIVNGGANINIESDSTTVGGIYLRNGITFNDAEFTFFCEEGAHHAIDSEGDIKIIKGTYELYPGNGKGIQSEKNLYIGEENGNDEDLYLSIGTSDEGIEAMGITLYSGSIEIRANGDGINAASPGDECGENAKPCSGNCVCFIDIQGGRLSLISGEDGLDANGDIFISGGKVQIFAASDTENQPIDQDGILNITGGEIIAAGSSKMQGGVKAQTTQIAKIYNGSVSSGSLIVVTDNEGNELANINAPKEVSYIYFNYISSFNVTINSNEVTLSEPTQNQQPGPGDMQGPGQPQSDPAKGNGSFLGLSKILILFGIILL